MNVKLLNKFLSILQIYCNEFSWQNEYMISL